MDRNPMEEEKKSKSQLKREMLALQKLGEELVRLSEDQISKLDIPSALMDALLFAKTIKKHEAWRRQMQYIGTLMREIDPEPIHRALENALHGHKADMRIFKQAEEWRDKLLAGNDALLEELFTRFPHVDFQRMRQLVFNARKEKDGNKPPKSSRALFRYLRELLNSEEFYTANG